MKIAMTGGGTGGHVMVNQILIPKLQEENWNVVYLGSYNGIEKKMMEETIGVTYFGISTGKLRRYFSLENFKDPFRVIKGIYDAYGILKREKPQVIFSGGGFVSVPVIIAGWLNGIPSIIRETDYTMGLANRICMPLVKKVCVTFEDTLKYIKKEKAEYFGTIVRPELQEGNIDEAIRLTGFSNTLPTILIMGGSMGAERLNKAVWNMVLLWEDKFQVIHLCGKGKANKDISSKNYRQYEYVGKELSHFYALADLVVTRCGSNAVCEGMFLNKKMLLIPLTSKNSRGDQEKNAAYAQRLGFGKVLTEENLTALSFESSVNELLDSDIQKHSNLSSMSTKLALNENCKKQIACIRSVVLKDLSKQEWREYNVN